MEKKNIDIIPLKYKHIVNIFYKRRENMKLLGNYRNGNYEVEIYDDGTKVRKTEDDHFEADFPENIDLKITNRCTGTNCKFCHEGSGPLGEHSEAFCEKFIDTLHPYTELAIGGGNVLEYPQLITLLKRLKNKKVIANITVNQIHFEKNEDQIKELIDHGYIHGLGVSLVKPTDHFIEAMKAYPNAVIHAINGLISKSDLEKLKDNDLKLLILGYKDLRRGAVYHTENERPINTKQIWLQNHIAEYFDHFKVLSFDNLAIKQLDLKRFFTNSEWEEFYMGDDGTSTFYIDAVERKFAMNSTEPENRRYDLLDDVNEMFQIIKNHKKEKAS